MNENSKKPPWANKKLGQHYLNDEGVITRICSDMDDVAEAIIEVGPGPGILTRQLAGKGLPFHVIEKDRRFREYLLDWVGEDQIDIADALKIDMSGLFKSLGWSEKKIWLVSNLPYNIGVPLLIKFIQLPEIKYMTLMFQKEVGEKIISPKEGKKGPRMNSLMALCQNYFDCQFLCRVPSNAFVPPPKVDSLVVSLTRKKEPEISLEEFSSLEEFVKRIFAHKRKQLGTILKSSFNKGQLARIDRILFESNIDKKIRAETFDLETVQTLYKKIKEVKKWE